MQPDLDLLLKQVFTVLGEDASIGALQSVDEWLDAINKRLEQPQFSPCLLPIVTPSMALPYRFESDSLIRSYIYCYHPAASAVENGARTSPLLLATHR